MNNEIIIDFSKAIKIIQENKKEILIAFMISVLFGIILNFAVPKKYTSEAKILIKKTGSTNLSSINPFVIQETGEQNNYDNLVSANNFLNEELEIMKSSLVIDNAIKENNLVYKKGPAKGKYISTKDFLKKNLTITKLKNADIIYISYKSKDPLLSYNIVNSIINNYKKTQEKLNTNKAFEDIEFLKKTLSKAEKELHSKIQRLKNFKTQPQSAIDGFKTSNLQLLSFYDKRFKQKFKQISDNETDIKNLEAEISQKTEEINSIKKKLEWSSMIKEISKDTTNIVLLESPEIKEKYDFSEPNLIVIIILTLFCWIGLSFMAIYSRVLRNATGF